MKTMKKLMALTLAFVMAMALAIPSFAVETAGKDFDAPLTITGLTNGDEAHFYQVIKWVGNETGNVNGWKAVSPFDTVLDKDTLTAVLSDGKIDSDLAGKLAVKANGEGTTIVASDGAAVLENSTPGMWMAIIKPVDPATVYNPVFISGDYNVTSGGTSYAIGDYNGDAVAKKSPLTLTKEGEDSKTVDSDGKHTVAVGDTMTFTVTTTIPGYGDVYTKPVFELTDTLNGLALNGDSVTVTDPSGLTKGNQYSVKDVTSDGYTLAFSDGYLKTVKTPTSVTITYTAVVTVDAKDAINQTDNEVTLKFSNNPNDQNDYGILKDTTQHYTFTLDASGIGGGDKTSQKGTKTSELVKIGVDANGQPITEKTETSTIEDGTKESWEGPLSGAVFGLFTNEGGTTPLKDKDNKDVTATTGSDGRMTFAGLDAGTYYIKEISAPTGFVTSDKVYKVDIVADTEEVTVTETEQGKEVTYQTDVLKSYTVTITDLETNTTTEAAKYTFANKAETTSNDIQWTELTCVEHPFPFTNTKGVELPSTGGIGTKIFYALGAVLVIGAGVVLVSRKRALD